MASVLIIDDDPVFCDVLTRAISLLGHNVTFSLSLKEGIKAVSSQAFDVVMLDVQLPDGNGITAIPKILDMESRPEVIIITGSGDPDGAEIAVKSGAWDYIEKPATVDAMTLPLVRAIEYRKEKLQIKPPLTLDRGGIVGDSEKMRACLELVASASVSEVTVLITGETGTGKELIASAIHKNSPRSDAPFIVVDCGALPASLVESVLFGHAKGAFTGADKSQPGMIKQADGGTLFLDEVAELPLFLQKNFLRVLQERRFRPVGAKKEEKSDFRLIAATNRNLDGMVKNETFRSDLMYRLRSLDIELPPLRQRFEDIQDLAIYEMTRICKQSDKAMKGFSRDFFETLRAYDWPGNVRELFNTIHSVLTVAGDNPIITPYFLPVHIRAKAARASVNGKTDLISHGDAIADEGFLVGQKILPYKEYRIKLAELGEKRYFSHLTSLAKGNVKEACRLSGLSRSRLYHLLQKHGLSLSSANHN